MKKMVIGFVAVVLAVSGCASQSPRIEKTTYRNGVAETIVLSEYFEDKQVIANGKVLAHLITTLGSERIPDDVDLDISWEQRKFSGQIEAAIEVYFTNLSDEEVVINGADIDIYRAGRGDYLPLLKSAIKIPAGQFMKSEAIYTPTSVYRGPQLMPMNISIDGEHYQVEFRERRTPVSELGR